MGTLPNIGEAAAAAYAAEVRLAALNIECKDAKAEKDETRAMLDALLEETGQSGASVDLPDEGKRMTYYYVNKAHFDIHNEAEVYEWASAEDENYIDPTPHLRARLIFEECRRRNEEGLPLPPGIVKRSEKELHKRTARL
ncbi:MAG: hypothetical protein ACREBC_29530 [Pyrinomonadaceae bacterium]